MHLFAMREQLLQHKTNILVWFSFKNSYRCMLFILTYDITLKVQICFLYLHLPASSTLTIVRVP